MANNKWYVLTGGPSSGKTTLISELKKRKYVTVPEAARTWIDQEISSGKTIEDIRGDEEKFQLALVSLKEEIEKELPADRPVFFDRGMHDTVAYLRYYGFSISAELQSIFDNSQYKKVFVLDMLPVYKKDYARTEDDAFAREITGLLESAYRDAKFNVVRVPVLPIKERAQFILDRIDE